MPLPHLKRLESKGTPVALAAKYLMETQIEALITDFKSWLVLQH
jgi:hypothetical protein